MYCPNCNKEVNTVWRYGRERCQICNKGLDKNPIKIVLQEIPDRRERTRRVVEQMVSSGEISKKDLE